jgi:putative endonuclease
MNYVYILECSDGTFYTGWTNNLEKRIVMHSKGTGAKYTKGRGPVKLMYHEEFQDKKDAMRREYEIKKLTRKQKEILILKNNVKNLN